MKRIGGVIRYSYLAAVFGFILLPVLALVLFSFQDGALAVPPLRGLSLRWYEALFADGRMMAALRNSALVAITSALICTVLGFLAAYGLARFRPKGVQALRAFLIAPLGVSYLVIGLGLSLAFSELAIGRSLITVTIGHVVINLPLAFAIILSQMNEQQARFEQAARDLGARESRVLALVAVPLLAPGLLAAFLLSFTLSWDEFVIALLLTRFDVTLPVEIWSALRTGLNPKTNAAGTIVFALSIGMLIITYALIRRRLEKQR
ncbi:MAG: ABC transporter permease [Acidimicrobiia bacterium]|nr:ABC transporter permease [Acidimicrobiia bacterium]